MAVNEKPVYALEHISGEGSRIPYQPGQVVSGRLPEHAIKSLRERGLVTDSAEQAKRAAAADGERAADVADQIAKRSEKREQSNR